MPTGTSVITISVEDRASRDRQLEQGISLLRKEATDCGILVIRVDFTTFTVTFNPSIAIGLPRKLTCCEEQRASSQDPTQLSEPDVVDLPKQPHAQQEGGLPYPIEGQQQEEVEKHPLLT